MLLACLVDEPLDEAEVYDADPVLRVLIVRFVAALADEDVVQLEVVVGEAGLVDEPELFKKPKTDFQGAGERKRFITFE